jgi:hypothetical protein
MLKVDMKTVDPASMIFKKYSEDHCLVSIVSDNSKIESKSESLKPFQGVPMWNAPTDPHSVLLLLYTLNQHKGIDCTGHAEA